MLPSRFLFLRGLIAGKFRLRGLLSLFGLMLSLSIGLGVFAPLRSETVALSPKASSTENQDCSVPADLCKQIKKQAQDDIDADEKKRTEYIIKRFTSLHPSWKEKLSAPETAKIELAIANTYEQEYNKQDEIKKRDLLAALKKFFERGLTVPMTLAGLGIILVWFREAASRKWMELVKKIDHWVYGQFAGTPFFESLALKRYREGASQLCNKYNCTMK
jgi:hypothetical protein